VCRWPALDERLAVKAVLRAFHVEETISYINHRLTAAGASGTIFQADAMEAVHQLTRGNARRVNRLCDLALLVGFAEGHDTITAEQVEAVAEELLPTSHGRSA
jgi:general secretion pathway protein A